SHRHWRQECRATPSSGRGRRDELPSTAMPIQEPMSISQREAYSSRHCRMSPGLRNVEHRHLPIDRSKAAARVFDDRLDRGDLYRQSLLAGYGLAESLRLVSAFSSEHKCEIGFEPRSGEVLESRRETRAYSERAHSCGPEKLICLEWIYDHRLSGNERRVNRPVAAVMDDRDAAGEQPRMRDVLVQNEHVFRRLPRRQVRRLEHTANGKSPARLENLSRSRFACRAEEHRMGAKAGEYRWGPVVQEISEPRRRSPSRLIVERYVAGDLHVRQPIGRSREYCRTRMQQVKCAFAKLPLPGKMPEPASPLPEPPERRRVRRTHREILARLVRHCGGNYSRALASKSAEQRVRRNTPNHGDDPGIIPAAKATPQPIGLFFLIPVRLSRHPAVAVSHAHSRYGALAGLGAHEDRLRNACATQPF